MRPLHLLELCCISPVPRTALLLRVAAVVVQPWSGQAPVHQPQYLPSLSEVDLGWFQGKRNGEQQQQQQPPP